MSEELDAATLRRLLDDRKRDLACLLVENKLLKDKARFVDSLKFEIELLKRRNYYRAQQVTKIKAKNKVFAQLYD